LGSRVPFGLKIFLTAVAIVDDLIAVLVIALFYTSELNLSALGIGLAFWLVLLAANMYGIRNRIVYASIGVLIWLTFLRSGVHATIAGVLIAFTVPSRYRIDAPTFLERARSLLAHFEQGNFAKTPMLTDETQQGAVIELEELCEQVQAPLQKFEHSLHGWVALLIMPLFALANAGVPLALNTLSGETSWVAIGVILGLVLGKPIGLIGATWLTVRFGIADLPQGATWRHMLGIGMLAGIGFTMSLFIATLGFSDVTMLDTAKLSVLIGSLISGTCGLLWLGRMRPAPENA
jgi:NhaA family Na+:H+ antiporter